MAAHAVRCRCGHDLAAHRHFRRGADCGACGAAVCPDFSAADGSGSLWRRFRARVGGRRGATVIEYPGHRSGGMVRRPGDAPDESVPREA